MNSCRLVLAQLNPLVGDLEGNAKQVLEAVRQAREQESADLVVFPELMLTGYPPEDLLLRADFIAAAQRQLERLAGDLGADAPVVVLGYPRRHNGALYNAAGVLERGVVVAEYAKQCLPNYRVFDEKRYFSAGDRPLVFQCRDIPVGLSICEDLWEEAPARAAAQAGARLLLNINASPFHHHKQEERRQLLQRRAAQHGLPVLYLNLVGGQDELVFDGGSMGADAGGRLCMAAPNFECGLYPLQLEWDGRNCILQDGIMSTPLPEVEAMYQALLLGVRDYVRKNHFPGVLIGLSGGIDSALTLAVAVEALGAECVRAVMMPSRHTAAMSREDAALLAQNLGVHFGEFSIEPMYESFLQSLSAAEDAAAEGVTAENIQARCRGTLLMALSNSSGALVLTTGNKSETAVGYSTLYGDMAGGFNVLKDVSKTQVYALARHCNRERQIIPQRILERAPSAELRPDQKDEDSMPPYSVIDPILEAYIEDDAALEEIVAAGFPRPVVQQVLQMVDRNEYKRRQAPIGIRLSPRGFGRDRRYPISSGWRGWEKT